MSGTALEHRLVREYLTQLDVALGGLPSAKARELRSQIAGHLEEAMPPDASDEDVAEVLHQLGRPAELAREAQAGAAPGVGTAVAAAARRSWVRIIRSRLRTKLFVVLSVLLLATGATFLSTFMSAPLPDNAGQFAWWYPQDHPVESVADGAQQTTVRIRSGQRQGFAIGIFNTSNFTETIIGRPTGLNAPWDSPNGGFGLPRIEVSAPDREIANGGFIRNVAFESLPVSIPPHQYRLLRITWISAICMLGGTKTSNMLNDGYSAIDSIYLQVRVGWFTRTDVIPLDEAVAIAGPSPGVYNGPGPITAPATETLNRMDPARALRDVAFQLERAGAPTYRVRAFRRAAQVVTELPADELARRIGAATLTDLPGIGPATAAVVEQAAAGEEPAYLSRLLAEAGPALRTGLRAALRGDCHTHSDWSDGGSPPLEMAEAARDLGHEWIALTDHSPRLTVANGLSPERLEQQLDLLRQLNAELAPFRILSGIEVDILDDGALDQRDDLLARLDVVVASVHSKLRMPGAEMTSRMVAAIANPRVDVLGHCTGRMVLGRGRPESQFDPEQVFAACRDHGVAVEINCRPERQDPPDRLLAIAVEAGCLFAIDTDAHAPGQLDWLTSGCERAERAGIGPDRVINASTPPRSDR